jgi:Transglutaminase-like superfamily
VTDDGPAGRIGAAIDVMRAATAVMAARRVMASRPIGEFVARASATTRDPRREARSHAVSPSVSDQRQILRWSTAVDRALRWLPGDQACLVRASALRALLAANGVADAEVKIGVRRGDGAFAAHAWVELHGTPIAEPAALRGAFASFDGVTVR